MRRVLYIAGPMTGYEDLNYPAFNHAEEQLIDAGYKTLNPTEATKGLPDDLKLSWEWYMRSALRMVTYADGIALLPGWQQSPGATLEVEVAQKLAIPCREVNEWLQAMREVS